MTAAGLGRRVVLTCWKKLGLGVLLVVGACRSGTAITWLPFGPDGGDARAFAVDPRDHAHLYLGTADGWMYESRDEGHGWKRLARVGRRDDLVLDNIVVDPKEPRHILVGAWVLGQTDGGLYISNDAGTTWVSNPEMRGQSIRAMAAAPSDSKIVVAGTLRGVYRSLDGGSHWGLISPPESQEIHEVESVAIDPKDPNVIYAGTWHLPWKTTDGGKTWSNIKQGVIDDSDVFSIIVDPQEPQTVYASACSGIYKSEDAGLEFHKVQGIPSSARRTRVLMQDPEHLETVYAGTTEGLFRSDDAGKTWVRMTGPEIVVNDVYVDPQDSKRVMLATDRGGVLSSTDRGNSFEPSNRGFSARQITAYVADLRRPSDLYVGVVNDKDWGGVFVSDTGGLSWNQQSSGLSGLDVLSLGQASDGTLIAGTSHGFYRLSGGMWSKVTSVSVQPQQNRIVPGRKQDSASHATKASHTASKMGATRQTTAVAKTRSQDHGAVSNVNAIARSGDTLLAATGEGLLESRTAGESWTAVRGMEQTGLLYVAASGPYIVAGDLKTLMFSKDRGETWSPVPVPGGFGQIAAAAVDAAGTVWVGGGQGVFFSTDQGANWSGLKNVSIRDANSLFYDESSKRMLVTEGGKSTIAFAVQIPEHTVSFWDTGWNLRFVRPVGDHLVAATMFDGIVVQPQMVDSAKVGR